MVDMISEHFATIANALSPRYRLERLLYPVQCVLGDFAEELQG